MVPDNELCSKTPPGGIPGRLWKIFKEIQLQTFGGQNPCRLPFGLIKNPSSKKLRFKMDFPTFVGHDW
jgi:hypothetical protein